MLPRCNRNVVIVSPKYGDTHYACEVVVAAKDLLPWAEHHSDAVRSLDQEEQVAREALPIWLRGASSGDKPASYVHYFMHKVLGPYASNFIKDGTANIYCLECQSFVTGVQMETLDKKRTGNWSRSTSVWTCTRGHQLYYQKHRIHVCY